MINYNRNLLAYGVRVGMYIGMGVLVATVWVKLPELDTRINDRLSVHFFSVAFLGFMSVAGIPSFLEEREVLLREKRNGLYGALPFVISNTAVTLRECRLDAGDDKNAVILTDTSFFPSSLPLCLLLALRRHRLLVRWLASWSGKLLPLHGLPLPRRICCRSAVLADRRSGTDLRGGLGSRCFRQWLLDGSPR